MKIGPIELPNNLVLAPMAGVTDLPFRRLCRRMGAGMTVSEMISSNSALRRNRKTLQRMDHTGEPEPISVQILGNDPDTMAEAARINALQGAQIIDINMGCPAKKVCRAAAGSALMKDERLVSRILEAVVNAVDRPVTLKIRTGWDKKSRNAVQIARIAEHSGVAMLAVHGRTRACGFSGSAEYDTIRQIKQTVNIPVVANGDVDSPRKAKEVLAYTGADGLMIGRAAQGRPWIFREIQGYLSTGRYSPAPSPSRIRDILMEHLDDLYSFYGEYRGVRVARRHIAWYSKGQNHCARFRNLINDADSAHKQKSVITEYFNMLLQMEGLAA